MLKLLPYKARGKYKYSLVVACYNVEKYLDSFFTSLKEQRLDFKRHLQVICVDDGSTDNTASIIQKWSKLYPKNIFYYHKENGGVASARNLGIEQVIHPFVTFADPDDFFHPNYFKCVDDYLRTHSNTALVVNNLHFFYEKDGITSDSHPLKFRFKEAVSEFRGHELDNFFTMGVNTGVFASRIIKEEKLQFDPRVKPTFEDSKFVGEFLLHCTNDDKVAFLRDAIYFYRKRADGSSLIDTTWTKKEKFGDCLEFGDLALLQTYQDKLGYVPKFVQRMVLYNLSWFFKALYNSDERVKFLSQAEKERSLSLLEQIFTYIDYQTIVSFEINNLFYFFKSGILGKFKQAQLPQTYVYVEKVDRAKEQLQLTYFTYFPQEQVSFSFCQQEQRTVLPLHSKTVTHMLLDQPFVYEKRFWLPYAQLEQAVGEPKEPKEQKELKSELAHASRQEQIQEQIQEQELQVTVNGKPAVLVIKGKHYHALVTVQEILTELKPHARYANKDIWIFIDRHSNADDNAEHLCRYVKEHHREQEYYFALEKDTPDWQRLEAEGFNLLAFGSNAFKQKLAQADKIISSNIDGYISDYFGDNYNLSKKLVFLQHGVTHNNLSKWLNSKKGIACITAATPAEYDYLVKDYGRFFFTDKEVKLTGFPRHDSLLKGNQRGKKTILIMPTWRQKIVGTSFKGRQERTVNQEFAQSQFAQCWRNFLHSKQLKELAVDQGYKVIFAPHINIAPYLEEFALPEYIQAWDIRTSKVKIQQLMQEAQILITDYSSVAFDFALLEKPVLYYQFDQEEFFSGLHLSAGYFSYEKDGFGPVVYNLEQLLQELQATIARGGEVEEVYASRIEETFPFRDGRCCERVYQVVKELDHNVY
ncbi:CDP-glycerol glycerophosphotransferase family protein [Psittacicella hinzii]|uniref:CDP-glycerol glycerophosphotransferase family protein n=1 Tax=Psittacicella hinzii TaxID=2028575 RepID=UPI001CA66CD2|nr:CDP-glycerol glycerophosphotransferase family protein [Psittacicella hinzii]